MPQPAVQQVSKKRKVAKTGAERVPAAMKLVGKVPAKKAAKVAPARKAAPLKTAHSSAAQKVAKIMRGAEALQLLVDAGILTATGNLRRRFK